MTTHHNKAKGFTLLEILVALMIFSVVAIIISAGLQYLTRAYHGSTERAKRWRQIQYTVSLLNNDMSQMINRIATDKLGHFQPALIGTPTSVTFSRTGVHASPLNERRSALERVHYQWQAEALFRHFFPYLAQAPNAQPLSQLCLQGVSQISFHYLNWKNQWCAHWPCLKYTRSTRTLPRAIALSLTLKDLGTVHRIFVNPAALPT